ncbi:MAG: acyl-CoA thioesterase [Saprospirales bacterium]|nr:acyl-CoA thioesterase [Saprospirales bacterium]MBK6903747.1 acyl-CoA thioesterase [Saprospirales bacterium]
MYTHEYQKRVRYGETDQMGYVYYGNYAQYYEIGRVEMLRSLGMTYKEMEQDMGIMMPVVNLEIRYLRPARYDELLTIKTSLQSLPGEKYILFHVEIFNEEERLINGGSVRLCFVDIKSGKTVPPPEALMERLRPFFEEK